MIDYTKIRAAIVEAMKNQGADTIGAAAYVCPELLRDYISTVKAESEGLMLYAFIAFGYKRIICAADKFEAIQKAEEIATEKKYGNWTLYDQYGNVIEEALPPF